MSWEESPKKKEEKLNTKPTKKRKEKLSRLRKDRQETSKLWAHAVKQSRQPFSESVGAFCFLSPGLCRLRLGEYLAKLFILRKP